MIKWFTKDWWQFLLEKPFSFRAFWCRRGGHKCGVYWYSTSNAVEPDMHCRNCGDDLG